MADGKKSFTAYCDWKETFNALPDDKAGQLIKHIFSYVNDENPETDDVLINAVFAQIKATLKRDLKKWEGRKNERSKSGILGNLKRYQKDLYDKVISEEISLEEAQELAKGRIAIQSDTKLAVSDSVRVSVRVDNKLSIYSEKDFLLDWKEQREDILKKPTHVTKLSSFEYTALQTVLKSYKKEDVVNSLKALFRQEVIKFTAMQSRPKHFLEHFETYHTAYQERDTQLWGKKPIQARL